MSTSSVAPSTRRGEPARLFSSTGKCILRERACRCCRARLKPEAVDFFHLFKRKSKKHRARLLVLVAKPQKLTQIARISGQCGIHHGANLSPCSRRTGTFLSSSSININPISTPQLDRSSRQKSSISSHGPPGNEDRMGHAGACIACRRPSSWK